MPRTETGSRRLALIVGGLVLTVFLIGALLSNLARSAPAEETPRSGVTVPPQSTVPAGATGPVDEVAGMAVGFAPDEDGAVSAGVAYATASQRWLYFTDEEIRDAVTQIATPTAAPGLAEDVVTEVADARERLEVSSGPVWWLVRPLAWQAESYNGERARISVWVVTILSAAEVAAPQTEWMTVTVDLAWSERDWRVDAVLDAPGPTPLTGPNDRPWDSEAFDEGLEGFTRMDGEPVR